MMPMSTSLPMKSMKTSTPIDQYTSHISPTIPQLTGHTINLNELLTDMKQSISLNTMLNLNTISLNELLTDMKSISHNIILSISLNTIIVMLVATKLMFQCMESCTSLSQCLHLLFTDQSLSIFPSLRSLWLHINLPNMIINQQSMNIVKLYMDQLTIMGELVTIASQSIILSLNTTLLNLNILLSPNTILAMLVATKLMFQCMESCTSPSQCLPLSLRELSPSTFPSQRSLWPHIKQ